MSAKYSGTPFNREQLIELVEVQLIAALGMIEMSLPTSIKRGSRIKIGGWKRLTSFEEGVLSHLGSSLAILYAHINDDGLGDFDALTCAGNFYTQCTELVQVACDNWDEIAADETPLIPHRYSNWPDAKRCAELFVDSLFTFKD